MSWSAEQRRLAGERMRVRRLSPEFRARHAAAMADPDVRARKSAAMKRAMADPDVRARHAAAMADPDVRARHAAAKDWLSAADRALLVQQLKARRPYVEIANDFLISISRVGAIAAEEGLQVRGPRRRGDGGASPRAGTYGA